MRHGLVEKKVWDFIESRNLLDGRDGVVVAVSGGSDSIALAQILHNLNRGRGLGLKIVVAHLNHKLRRQESDGDAEYVKRFARTLALPFRLKNVDISRVSRDAGLSIEEAARVERYKFLESCAVESGAGLVAAGHTADDDVETVMHRIIRGAGIHGLCGINPERSISPGSDIVLIRPILHLWKSDVLRYLEDLNIPFRMDSSNTEKVHMRNRIRLDLLPLLEKGYNRQIKHSLANLSAILGDHCELVDELAGALFTEAFVKQCNDRSVFKTSVIAVSPAAVQQRLIHNILSSMGAPLKRVGYRHYRRIIDFIKGGSDGEVVRILPALAVSREGGSLSFSTSTDDDLPGIRSRGGKTHSAILFGEVSLVAPGVTELPEIGTSIETGIVDNYDGLLERLRLGHAGAANNVEAIDMAKVKLPLRARPRRPGDRFRPIGAPGSKKIKDFFIDNKVPRHQRDRAPVITSADGAPVWLVGFRIDDRVKISERTERVIVLRYSD